MRLINATYPTYPEEIKQELAVNSFTARLKQISEAYAYALQFEVAKQTSRNQERIIRRVKVSRDYRKTNEAIFMWLMMELQEFLNEGETHDNNNTTLRSRNRILCWKCGQEGHLQSHSTRSIVPYSDPDGYRLHIANTGDDVR